MATQYKNLVVSLRARIGNFRKKMAGAGNALARVGKRAKLAAGMVAKMGLRMAAGAVVAVGGMTLLVKNSMKAIDVIAKLSDRIGVATEDIVGLGYAASIMGSDEETMNKALEIFVRRLGEVRMGTGEAKDGLEALGISADQLVNMKTADAFLLVADGLSKIPKAADKAATAYKLFGRQGAKLVNLFDLGAEGIRKLIKRFVELGGSFDRIDAAAVERANDALNDAKKATAGLVTQLTIQLAPAIEAMAKLLTNAGIDGKVAAAEIEAGFASAAIVVGKLADAARMVAKGWHLAVLGGQGLIKVIADIGIARDRLFARLPGKAGEAAKASLRLSEAMSAAAAEREKEINATLDKLFAAPSTAEGIRKWLDEVKAAAQKARDALAKGDGTGAGGGPTGIGEVFEKAKAKIDRFNDSLVAQIAMFGKSRHELQLFNLEQAGLGLTGAGASRFAGLIEDAKHYIAKLDEMSRKEAALDKLKAPTPAPTPAAAPAAAAAAKSADTFGVLSRGISLMSLAKRMGDDDQKTIATNTARTADTLERIDRKAGKGGAVYFAKA